MAGGGAKRSRKKRSGAGNAPAPNSDWLAWLATVPTEDRSALAKRVRDIREPSFEALGELTIEAMAALLEGQLSPDISRELRAWTELKMATVAAARAAKSPNSAITLVGLLTETDFEAPELKPAYTHRERIIEGEVMEDATEEAPLVELKA